VKLSATALTRRELELAKLDQRLGWFIGSAIAQPKGTDSPDVMIVDSIGQFFGLFRALAIIFGFCHGRSRTELGTPSLC
jgi:hypothetical protein